MEYSKTLQDTTNLTDLEQKVLKASRTTDFGDAIEEHGTWSFSVADSAGMPEKTYRGVAGSLVKKGLVAIQDQEGRGKARDMVFCLTQAGKARFIPPEETRTIIFRREGDKIKVEGFSDGTLLDIFAFEGLGGQAVYETAAKALFDLSKRMKGEAA